MSITTVSKVSDLTFGETSLLSQPPPNPKTLVAEITLSSGRMPKVSRTTVFRVNDLAFGQTHVLISLSQNPKNE